MSFTFGQTSGGNAPNLFGTAGPDKAVNSGSSLFGGTQTGGSSLFGNKAASTPVAPLAPTSNAPTSSAPSTSLFGSNTTSTPSLFSSKPQTGGQTLGSPAGAIGTAPSQSSIFTTPSKSAEAAKSADGTKSLFGGVSNVQGSSSSMNLFGTTTGASTTTTPAAPKTVNFMGNTSTTPAGAPPASGVSTAGTLFGSIEQGKTYDQNTKPSGGFSGGPNSFGSVAQTASGGGGLFSKPPENKPSGLSFFSGVAPSQKTSASVNTDSASTGGQQAPQGLSAKPLFGGTVANTPTGPSQPSIASSSSGTSKNTPTFTLTASTPQAQSKQSPSQPPATTGAGSSGFLASQSTASGQPSTTASGSTAASSHGSLFTLAAGPSASIAPGQSGSSGPSNPSLQSASFPVTSAAVPAVGVTGQTTTSSTAQPIPVTATTVAATAAATTATMANSVSASDPSKTNVGLGASTSGPKPNPQSRLKNKSMDEIITRWASDLQKYQKEFQKQASQVADWDKVLVTSSEQIQKLYGSTLEAERATAEVERQLAAVENDQSEIEYWLEHYEKQVEELLAAQGSAGSFGEGLQGPDAERERTFKMAEKLNDRLTEMGKDLGSMVDEINEANKGLTTGSQGDDPLSQIVRVLNGHLAQLQSIDQESTKLQTKVNAVQVSGRKVATNGGLLSNNASDDFFKSYMGRK